MSTSSWVDEFARWTIRHAAHRAAPPLAERLEEEWLADLEARPAPWSRLALGIGCCWAAAVIVQEDIAPCLTAATTTGNKVMSSYASTNGSLVPQRTTALAIIIGLHVALVFAFATGLAHRVITVLPPAITGTVLDPKPKDQPPPPPASNPVFRDPKIADPVYPDIPTLDTGPDTDAIHTPVVERAPPGPPTAPPPPPVHRVQGGAGKGFPNSADYYPPASIRSNETGTVAVNVCVDTKGRLTGNPTISKSSGFPRLDDGALKLAHAGSGHYRATTENGQPVDSCYAVGITFTLK